jgi:F0F1-type ATP synthase membrane subunit a
VRVQIVVFILMSTVVFLGFAQSFFLGFYVTNEGFQTLQEALVSMVRFTSGDVDYDALKKTNTVLAPLLYTLALFVLGFVWTSLLLAIVINAYYDEINDVRRSCRSLSLCVVLCTQARRLHACTPHISAAVRRAPLQR